VFVGRRNELARASVIRKSFPEALTINITVTWHVIYFEVCLEVCHKDSGGDKCVIYQYV
jgi:hypothetical protein